MGPLSRMGGQVNRWIWSGFAGGALSCNSVRDIINGRLPCAGNVAGGLREMGVETMPCVAAAQPGVPQSPFSTERIDYLDGKVGTITPRCQSTDIFAASTFSFNHQPLPDSILRFIAIPTSILGHIETDTFARFTHLESE